MAGSYWSTRVTLLVVLASCACERVGAVLSAYSLAAPVDIDVDEGQSERRSIYQVLITSDAPASIVYSLVNAQTGAPFVIDADTGEVDILASPSLDFEAAITTFNLQITVRDHDDTATGTLNVNVRDVNEPPVFNNLPATTQVFEETVGTSDIFTVTADDPEEEALTFTCTVDIDDGNFPPDMCDGGIVSHVAGNTFHVETTPIYVINVTVTDGTHEVSDILTVIVMNNYNDRPYFTNLNTTVEVSEATGVGETVYTVAVTDPEDDDITVMEISRIEPDSGRQLFNVTSGGEVQLLAALDYETQPTQYVAYLNACDAAGLCAEPEGNLTITITDENDPPEIALMSPALIPENQTAGYVVMVAYDVSDPENGALLYSLIDGYGDYLDFTVNSADGSVVTTKSYDYEEADELQVFYLRVAVQDALGLTTETNITLQVADVNEFSPVFEYRMYVGTFQENYRGSVMTLGVSDGDSGPVYGNFRVTIDDPTARQLFYVTSSNTEARIRVRQEMDMEALADPTFRFMLTATDGGGLTDTVEVELTVTDVNEYAPTITLDSVSVLAVRSDASDNEEIGQVIADDRDRGGEPLIFSLVNGSSESFSVWYLDGSVRALGNLIPDQLYTVSVIVTDSGEPPRSSDPVSIEVCAYDPTEYLTDWEVYQGDDGSLSNRERREILSRISAHCVCNAVLADYSKLDNSDNWVLQIYLEDLSSAGLCPKTFVDKAEVMSTYTGSSSGGDVNDIGADMVAGDVEMLRVQESITSPRDSFWLDTAGGIIVILLLCVIGAIVLIALLVALFDYFWWMHRPEYRIFHNKVNKPQINRYAEEPRPTSAPISSRSVVMTSPVEHHGIEATLPGTPVFNRKA